MRDFIKGKYPDLVKRIEDTKDLSKDDEDKLQQAMKEWKTSATY
jgi:F-type H+-transporting ATPase subunit alpha